MAPDRYFPPLLIDNPVRRLLSPPGRLVSKYVEEGEAVADIGCGPGYYTLAMAEAVGEGGKVYAADPDPRAIEALERKLGDRRGVVEARAASAADLGFIPDRSVDFVLANGMICCMTEHSAALREIRRIMKPSGSAYISVSKMFSRRDPRGVGREEWEQTLAGFSVLERGDGLATRWAHVALITLT